MVAVREKLAWPSERRVPDLGPPLPEGTTVVSVDSHIMEPGDMWVERVPDHLKDRAPRILKEDAGYVMVLDGQRLDIPGFNSLLIEGRPGLHDVGARLDDLAAEGVDKELLFPQRAFTVVAHPEHEYVLACVRAYNQYLSEYCRADPTRFYGVGILPWWEPDATADHIAELQDLGFRAFVIPISPPGVFYNSRSMEPMWSAIEESGIPLSFHVGEGHPSRGMGALGTNIMMQLQPYRRVFSLFAFSGILERHPELRVVFTEGGISWIPGALHDADAIYAAFESEMHPRLANPPSHYWFQNCHATFQVDAPGLEQLDRMGPEKVMWASDYPHPESTVGYTRESVWDVFRATTVENAQAIVGGTAIDLWGLDN